MPGSSEVADAAGPVTWQVSETLHYTAELRMPGHTTREQRQVGA